MKIANLSKSFGKKDILNEIDLTIPKGNSLLLSDPMVLANQPFWLV